MLPCRRKSSRSRCRPSAAFACKGKESLMRKIVLILCVVVFAACQKSETTTTETTATGTSGTTATVRLQGAGSTFDNPLFSKVFDAYQKKGGAEVNYQSIGSGGGVQQMIKGVVDF